MKIMQAVRVNCSLSFAQRIICRKGKERNAPHSDKEFSRVLRSSAYCMGFGAKWPLVLNYKVPIIMAGGEGSQFSGFLACSVSLSPAHCPVLCLRRQA